jgi:hypothetical protein
MSQYETYNQGAVATTRVVARKSKGWKWRFQWIRRQIFRNQRGELAMMHVLRRSGGLKFEKE